MSKSDDYLSALQEIARITSRFLPEELDRGDQPPKRPAASHDDDDDNSDAAEPTCSPMELPKKLRAQAARRAIRVNPMNAPRGKDGFSVVGNTTKFWGANVNTLTVRFMTSVSAATKKSILNYMNAWNKTCRIKFKETTTENGNIRIALGNSGNRSYVGTDNLQIPANQPTMWLQNYNVDYIVQHEAGHALALDHEQLRPEIVKRIIPAEAYKYFGAPPNNWTKAQVDRNVLTPLDFSKFSHTPVDTVSVMCYFLPAKLMKDGKEVKGGKAINDWDYWYIGQVYPKTAAAAGMGMAAAPVAIAGFEEDDLSIDEVDESDFEEGNNDDDGDDAN